MALLDEIHSYWSNRAEGYTEVNRKELAGTQKEDWLKVLEEHFPAVEKNTMKILDIGTGPGFFPTILAEAGYHVTAIDYTEAMLEQARENLIKAGDKTGKDLLSYVELRRMDAQHLAFANETFDVIISRNVTWNLEDPVQAYCEWYRVLKFGGKMLNFDANWYNYLYEDEKKTAFEQDRELVNEAGLEDYNQGEGVDIGVIENIARQVPLSKMHRPQWDLGILKGTPFEYVTADVDVWQRVWDQEERLNYRSTPMFMVEAVKASGTEKERIVTYWAKRSESFGAQKKAELNDPIAGRWLHELQQYLPEHRTLKILDIGCGAGFFSILLAKEGHDLTGIDLTPEMIDEAKMLAAEEGVACRFEIMDAEQTTFPNESFDAIITRNLTWTLPHADIAYEEWLRILKPGGVLINTDADYAHEKENNDEELPPLHAHHLIGKAMTEENVKIRDGLAISSCRRPQWDKAALRYAGVPEEKIYIDTTVGRRIYLRKDEFYNPAPIFLIAAYKPEE